VLPANHGATRTEPVGVGECRRGYAAGGDREAGFRKGRRRADCRAEAPEARTGRTGNAVRAMQLEAEIRANPELRADRFVESWQQLQDQRGRLTGSSNREARQQVESQMSDPQRWQALRDAASVWASNAKALEDCQRRAVKAGKGVSCSISVGDPQR